MTESEAAHLPWPDFTRRAATDPVVIGVGSFEQHGPHLPMATDAVIAHALAAAVAERVNGIVLPVFPYGAPSRPHSGGGDPFPAPDFGLPVLQAAIESVCRGAVAAGARRLVVFTWHFENAQVLWDAVKAVVTPESGAKAVLFPSPWDFIPQESLDALSPDGNVGQIDWPADHAGLLETAIMRAVAPQLTGEAPEPVDFKPRPYDVLPTPADAVPHTGVVNDARHVTAEAGQRCLDDMVAAIAAAVERDL